MHISRTNSFMMIHVYVVKQRTMFECINFQFCPFSHIRNSHIYYPYYNVIIYITTMHFVLNLVINLLLEWCCTLCNSWNTYGHHGKWFSCWGQKRPQQPISVSFLRSRMRVKEPENEIWNPDYIKWRLWSRNALSYMDTIGQLI